MNELIATIGDEVTQQCRVHCALCPCTGGGTYSITPSNPKNDFAKISGRLILVNGDEFVACCNASLTSSTTIFKINGVSVIRNNDVVNSPHNNNGVEVINQNFARCE